MALPATIQRFTIELADVDRDVYETIELRTAKHPSETDVYLVTRVIACLLHQSDGATMSRAGLCDPDDPPVLVRDLTGQMTHWIDLGLPAAARLHKASKAAQHVIVYCHKEPTAHLHNLSRTQIYRAEDIEFLALPPRLLEDIARHLARNNSWNVVRTEGELFITVGTQTFQGALTRHPLS